MKPYLAILKVRFAVLFQYRAVAFAGICTQIFWGMIMGMVLQAFFRESAASQPISLAQGLTFIWLGQALLQILPWNFDKEIEAQVRSGDVAYELIRPLELYRLWYTRVLAMRTVPVLIRSAPLFIVALIFFDLSWPVSWQAFAGFVASVILAAFLSAALTTVVIVSLFWTISGEGIVRMTPHLVMLMSGMVVPLPLFPESMQLFLNMQPCRGFIDIPARIYTGIIPGGEIWHYLGFQLLWILFFILLGRILMYRAIKKVVIQGG